MTADRLLEVVDDLDACPPFCAPELMQFKSCAAPWIAVADPTWPEFAREVALTRPDLDEDVRYRFELFTLELARAFPSETRQAFQTLLEFPDVSPDLRTFCEEVLETAGEKLPLG